jgi:hypothetical protein
MSPGKPPRCPRCRLLSKPAKPQGEVLRTLGVPARISVPAPPPAPAVPETRIAGTHEDDDRPYPVPKDPQQKEPCPRCKQSVALGTIVCNHCGFDRATTTVLQRVHEKVAKHWVSGLALQTRLTVFLVFIGATTLTALVNLASAEEGGTNILLTWMFGTLLLAFLLGTFSRIDLTRGKNGKVRLKKTWRVCFIPWNPIVIDWRGHEGVTVTRFHNSGFADWFVLIFLVVWDGLIVLMFGIILPIGTVGASVWWVCIIHADQFDVNLTKDHGSPAELLYRGRNEDVARDIADNLRNVTDLK